MDEFKPKQALGRGLSSLLGDIAEKVNASETVSLSQHSETSVTVLPIDKIVPNKDQPRRYFDEDKLIDLSKSIKQKGVIQPILVRSSPYNDTEYEIVAGERRWRAAQIAQIHSVPVIIKNISDVDALEIAIIENIQRADLNAIEEASAFKQLIEKYNYTQETLANNLGKSRPHIANTMRLLNLPEEVQQLVRNGTLSAGHARAILASPDPARFAQEVVQKQMSVRATELAAKGNGSSHNAPSSQKSDANTRAIEDELSAALQMKVSIRHKGARGGELSITYRNLDDLEELRDMLSGQSKPIFAAG